MNDLLFNLVRFFVRRSQVLRPVVRAVMPHEWQWSFSSWVFSRFHGPAHRWPDSRWVGLVCHRLYWLTNLRGEDPTYGWWWRAKRRLGF